jgi:ABC-2 type transport system ATP-binding protein
MEYAVIADKLVKRFGDFTAVDGISFKVGKGEIFGFLGPNGAGKTTTIKVLCGLLAPTSGSGSVGGYNIDAEQKKIKSLIGYMSQKFSLYGDLTALENLEFFGGIYGVKGPHLEKKIREISLFLNLSEIMVKITSDLSLGWKQRLALACAILHQPKILFLDEPTSGVAPDARRRFWSLINNLASVGVTVFVTTHYMDEAEHCDRLAFIDQGRIIALGTSREIKEMMDDGEILEIKCNRLLETLKLLESETYIKEAAPFGNSLHLSVRDEESAVKRIKFFLDANKIKLYSMKSIKPSLEDVFVRLVKKQYEIRHY